MPAQSHLLQRGRPKNRVQLKAGLGDHPLAASRLENQELEKLRLEDPLPGKHPASLGQSRQIVKVANQLRHLNVIEKNNPVSDHQGDD